MPQLPPQVAVFAVKAAGIAGIIHKAAEGVGFTDKLYADRRVRALGVGLLWGAYHFLRPGSIAASRIDGYLAAHRLWLAQYGPRPVTPRNWPSAWLWQFTGDGVGPKPHSVPGIVGSGIDINSYEGDAVKLAAE
ncbi:MAG: GH25 family lysozyme [Xanthobacteraceae bacterium]